MTWWQRLKKNDLARFGITVLLLFYLAVIGADFIAPYDPYVSEVDGSLLPPTQIYWRNLQGNWIGPHVYPTFQGPIDLETGSRELIVDRTEPSPLRLFVQGPEYRFLQLQVPLPTELDLPKPRIESISPLGELPIRIPWITNWSDLQVEIEQITLIPGIPSRLHLFGAQGPGRIHLLGTDSNARDEFSRLLFGGRISLSIGLLGVGITFPIGLLVGGISGYFGGWVDSVLMRLVEVMMSVPTIYLLVALSGIISPSLSSSERFLIIVIITAFVNWAGLARVIRGQVLSIKQREYVQAAKVMGGNALYIIVRHVLPQTATYVIIAATLAVPSFIASEALLSLIGLGIQQPDPSWGNMLSLATNASILILQPWLIWPPAIMIILTVLSFNLLGDALRDALDPQNLNS
ncbi:ABC transporter permease [Lyngbya confervoides]|uniref:ABC transporter permease n=1 Tax=Lyngbya confervoides BDU141951 TaxID=1574623 RepID=A0ABD4SZF8_9CYAN|nr:ABC transporter permease [Lyngbya confervoides]MCM1981857.1 ABC transporter permease [Lyngbya confervoides BDU141951]